MTQLPADAPRFVRGRMSQHRVESMLTRVLNSEQLFDEARGVLEPTHFDDSEFLLGLTWRAALLAHERTGSLEYTTIVDIAQELLDDSPYEIAPTEHMQLFSEDPERPGLLYWIFAGVDAGSLEIPHGRQLLRQFLQERMVADNIRSALEQSGTGTPGDLDRLLRRMVDDQQRIHEIDTNPVQEVLPDNWRPEPLDIIPTGITFMDEFMGGGGHACGEVNGLLGPFGVGKTTLAVQLAVQQAFQFYRRFCEEGGTLRVAYIFSYEQSAQEIREKAIAYAAQIHIERFSEIRGEEDLTRSGGELREYEIARAAEDRSQTDGVGAPLQGSTMSDGVPLLGEYERLQQAKTYLRDCLRIVDMSGATEGASRHGTGYVDEVASILRSASRDTGTEPGFVTLDYVGLVAWRYMQANGIRKDQLRHYVGMFGDEMKTKVARAFYVPVMLLHQFNGDANKRGVTSLLSHTQAAESSAFAQNFSYCFCLGNKDHETNCCLINASKRRRSGDPVAPKVLHIDGAFSQLVDASDRYAVDLAGGKIISREMQHQVAGDPSPQRPPSPSLSGAVSRHRADVESPPF